MRPLRAGLRRPAAALALAFLAVLVLAVAAAPLVAAHGPLEQNLRHVLEGPSGAHPLGTDNLGRDVLSRLLHGGRVSLVGVAEAVAVVLALGVPLGLAAGFLGGRVDAVVVAACDLVLAIPVIVVLLAVLATFGQDETAAMAMLGLLGTPGLARVVRGAALAVRREPYIAAARVAGLTTAQIIRRHVLPRAAGPIVVQAALFAGMALITESGLAFLGLGVQEPDPSWGGMVAAASNLINRDAWLLVPPGAVIALSVLAFGVVGDAVRDAVSGTAAAPARPRRAARRATTDPAQAPPRDGEALLSVRGLAVAFRSPQGDTTVVEDVGFDVCAGEAVGIVGESGCGKTVTARAVLGLLPGGGRVTAGACWYDGVDITRLPQHERRGLLGNEIALISQEPIAGLDPTYRVGDQLAEVVRVHGGGSRTAARARAVELLDEMRIADAAAVARRYPHELSGGMAQRVGIAAALAGSPRLLIADEPTTALDVTVQADILDLLRDLQSDRGMAIVVVTHDWGVVADLCERAVVMYAGTVVERTTVGEMFARPRHPYTEALMACDPTAGALGEPLRAIPGSVPSPGAWPTGCHFHPRCPLATEECRHRSVELARVGAAHDTRCLHHEELVA
ncbi:MAG: peptide/nickel transport system ATP-binding protein [Solirubrobacteraceae bacterium]